MKKTLPLGEIVASRELEFVDDGGRKQTVAVRLGKPIQEQDGAWFCPYEITAQGFERQFRIGGADSMQALFLAAKTVAVELEVLATDYKGSLTWFGEPDLGFWSSSN